MWLRIFLCLGISCLEFLIFVFCFIIDLVKFLSRLVMFIIKFKIVFVKGELG